jgi:hypothetical protein
VCVCVYVYVYVYVIWGKSGLALLGSVRYRIATASARDSVRLAAETYEHRSTAAVEHPVLAMKENTGTCTRIV